MRILDRTRQKKKIHPNNNDNKDDEDDEDADVDDDDDDNKDEITKDITPETRLIGNVFRVPYFVRKNSYEFGKFDRFARPSC